MSRIRLAAAFAAAGLLVAGCTPSTPDESATTTAAAPAGSAEETTAEESRLADFEMIDPWVKAATDGAMMTGAFGTLVNNTDEDIHVIAVSSPVTERSELHEMVDQGGTPVMAEMPDGFVVEAGSEFVLEPGGNHLMLMNLQDPIEAGEEVEFSLEFADGRTFSWIAPVRTYDGANEEYAGDEGEGHGNMGGEGATDGATDGTSAEETEEPAN